MKSYVVKLFGFCILLTVFSGCFSPDYLVYSGKIEYAVVEAGFPTGMSMQFDAIRGTANFNKMVSLYSIENSSYINQYISNSMPCFLGNAFRHRDEFDVKVEPQIFIFGFSDSSMYNSQVLFLGKKTPLSNTVYIKRVIYTADADGGYEAILNGCRFSDESDFLKLFEKMISMPHNQAKEVLASDLFPKYSGVDPDEEDNSALFAVKLFSVVIGFASGYFFVFFIVFLLGKQNDWNKLTVKRVAIGYGLLVAIMAFYSYLF